MGRHRAEAGVAGGVKAETCDAGRTVVLIVPPKHRMRHLQIRNSGNQNSGMKVCRVRPPSNGCPMLSSSPDGPREARNAARLSSFRREELCAPSCAQCHASMAVIRGEPDFENPSSIVVTYRCAECGLLERARIQDRLLTARTGRTSRFAQTLMPVRRQSAR